MDPIQYLPSETSTSIIQAALPRDGTYPVHLVDFTNVSDRWRNFLFSTPTLWSQLYLDETIPDLLVLLAVSIEHSGQTPLNLTVFGRSIHDWTGLGTLVRPFYHRVVQLAIKRNPGPPHTSNHIEDCFSALSTLFEHLGHPSNLIQLIFDEGLMPTLEQFDSLKLPATVYLLGKFHLEYPDFPDSENTGRLFNCVRNGSFGIKRQADMHLFPLALNYDQNTDVVRELSTGAKLLVGGDIAHCLKEYNSFEQFIFINSSNLASLVLYVDLVHLHDLFDCLRLLPNLQDLHLFFDLQNRSPSQGITPSRTTYTGLKALDVEVETEEIDHDLLGALFEALWYLYSRVESLSLRAQSWSPCISTYIKRLPALEYLRLALTNPLPINHGPSISLPFLHDLRIDGSFLPHPITTPNLLRLNVYGGFTTKMLTSLNALQLRKLVVFLERRLHTDSNESKRSNIEFNAQACPNLVELRVVLYGSLPRLQFSSFSGLVVIKLHSIRRFTDPIGNYLCLHFIYHPEHCPLLQELHSDRCLEWDLLFLMLERRNFGLIGVKKIHVVATSWVPFAIRSHLFRLLAGEPIKQPGPTSSLEETREVTFDSSIPGCHSCLRNERPGCSEGIIGIATKLWSSDEIYPKVDIPPIGIPPDVYRRLVQYEISVETWKDSYGACSFQRAQACSRWRL